MVLNRNDFAPARDILEKEPPPLEAADVPESRTTELGTAKLVERYSVADDRAIELGKLYLHNDICFPPQINVGEFLRVMETEKPDPGCIALGMHQNCTTCRAGQYAMVARKALDHAGLTDVPVVTSGTELRDLISLNGPVNAAIDEIARNR